MFPVVGVKPPLRCVAPTESIRLTWRILHVKVEAISLIEKVVFSLMDLINSFLTQEPTPVAQPRRLALEQVPGLSIVFQALLLFLAAISVVG